MSLCLQKRKEKICQFGKKHFKHKFTSFWYKNFVIKPDILCLQELYLNLGMFKYLHWKARQKYWGRATVFAVFTLVTEELCLCMCACFWPKLCYCSTPNLCFSWKVPCWISAKLLNKSVRICWHNASLASTCRPRPPALQRYASELSLYLSCQADWGPNTNTSWRSCKKYHLVEVMLAVV